MPRVDEATEPRILALALKLAEKELRRAGYIPPQPESPAPYIARPERQLLHEMRKRAHCTLTEADLRELCAPMVCAVTGLPLKRSVGGPSPLSPSIDRIEPAGPYAVGNVRLVAHGFNALRRRASIARDAEIARRFVATLDRPQPTNREYTHDAR